MENAGKVLKARVEELESNQANRKVSFEIGEMMLEAKKTADGIVSRANEKADAAQTALEAETLGISARLAEIRRQLSAASEEFKTYSGSILQSLEEMQRTIEESRSRLAQPPAAPPPKPAAPASRPQQPPKPRTESRDKNPYSFLFRK